MIHRKKTGGFFYRVVGEINCSYTTTTISCSICSMTTNDKQRVTLFLIPGILTHARAQAVVEGLSLTHLVERALIDYLPKETIIRKAKIREERA